MGKPKSKGNVKKRWTEEDMANALEAVENKTLSIRKAAKTYGLTESNIRRRRDKLEKGIPLVGSGRQTALTKEQELELVNCIRVLCNTGFSPLRKEIMYLVQEYVTVNNRTTPFKNNRPKKDWLRNFLDRNRLSCKKANIMCSARKNSTSNPFIVYDFYDVIEKHIRDDNLKPEQVWNLDETGFPTDPRRSRVVCPKGETAFKTTCGPGRENHTALATCNAAGKVLDPLIIFQGKNFWHSWKGKNPLPNTIYGRSDNGWMTTDVFFLWFTEFTKQIKERPAVVIYDGHLSHISIKLIQKAKKENITIIKLPPHVKDKMQPLDVCCFGPLKQKWDELLDERVNVLGPKASISKSTFVDLLCSIWHKYLKSSNVISGFRTTGIYPVDRTKYPEKRFDIRLKKRYDQWVKLGRPEEIMEDLATSVQTPKELKQPEDQPSNDVSFGNLENTSAGPSTPRDVSTPSTINLAVPTAGNASTPTIEKCECEICVSMPPKPPPVPGHEYVLAWFLHPIE